MENRFNLIDEPWIPVTELGKVGLRQIFENPSIKSLGGNPVEKIAVFKLLLAIAQSAVTPKDETEWESLGCEGMRQKILEYLNKNKDCFWLYGDRPFLQILGIKVAKSISFGAVMMHIASGNTTVVTEIQAESLQSDAEKALILLTLMGFAFGGKKTDNSVVLSKGYTGKSNGKGKPSSGKPGPSVCYMGMQHSFFFLESICNSLYFNLLTNQMLLNINMYSAGIGVAPWLDMPAGEDDEKARNLKKSYMGRLIPLNRFCLIDGDKIHYSEGILYSDYAEFVVDPSVSVDFAAKPKPRVIWINPSKKPWRELPSLLSFMENNKNNGFVCYQLKLISERLLKKNLFSVWSGGVRVSSNAGEQYLTGTDDFVESEIKLNSSIFAENSSFFSTLSKEMSNLSVFEKTLYNSVTHYYEDMKGSGKEISGNACNEYWQLCEGEFQGLVDTCCGENAEEELKKFRKKISGFVLQIYDSNCPAQTARQLELWAKNRPFLNKTKEEK